MSARKQVGYDLRVMASKRQPSQVCDVASIGRLFTFCVPRKTLRTLAGYLLSACKRAHVASCVPSLGTDAKNEVFPGEFGPSWETLP
jgi:hypothetical protein